MSELGTPMSIQSQKLLNETKNNKLSLFNKKVMKNNEKVKQYTQYTEFANNEWKWKRIILFIYVNLE